jgi:FkbM family methyltransferase
MKLSALISAAYVEVQRTTGRKPGLRSRILTLLKRPDEADFNALQAFKMPAGKCFVDIGANRGETIAAVRLFHPDTAIFAFEPNPLLKRLIRDRFARDSAVTLHPVGLGDIAGSFDLHVPYYKGVPFDGLASFDYKEAASWLSSDKLVGFKPQYQEIRTFTCNVSTLDIFDLAPGFIKIDVQGLEPAVIRGARATIAKHKPVILMENNRPDLDAAELLAMGYESFAYVDKRLVKKQSGSLNTFYIHAETRGMFDASIFA